MVAESFASHDDRPTEDQIVVLRDASWSDYQRVLELRGDRAVPRVAYLQGVLQLMSPSREHETIKSLIGRLVEAWCLEHDLEFGVYGSWTLESKPDERGVEPDECYIFGPPRGATRPDLAIEVIWTSGGIDQREIYRSLGVGELWFWRKGKINVYVLVDDAYEPRPRSAILPGIDLDELVTYLDQPTTSRAIREYRSAIVARRTP